MKPCRLAAPLAHQLPVKICKSILILIMSNPVHDHQHQKSSSSSTPKCYVVVHNVSKRHNIGTLLRCCTAFGVTKVVLVGTRHFNTFGSHGSAEHVSFLYYPTLEECCKRLREEHGCAIIGIEITSSAQPVTSNPFHTNTAFLLGNEGSGMSEKQMGLCDAFVYIPQYGGGTASLNVTVAASIVLHHYATWAGYSEHPREGYKFLVDDRPARTAPRGMVPLTPEELEAKRLRQQQQAAEQEGAADCAVGDLFDDDGIEECLSPS